MDGSTRELALRSR